MSVELHVVEAIRRIDARPDTVFPYFTDPQLLVQWQGRRVTSEAQPGGRFEVEFSDTVRIVGEFLEVDPPRRVRLTWGWIGATDPRLVEIGPGSSTVEITFEPDGEGTLVRVRHSSLPSEGAGEIHTLGWTTYLERLERLVAGVDPGSDPFRQLAERTTGRRDV